MWTLDAVFYMLVTEAGMELFSQDACVFQAGSLRVGLLSQPGVLSELVPRALGHNRLASHASNDEISASHYLYFRLLRVLMLLGSFLPFNSSNMHGTEQMRVV